MSAEVIDHLLRAADAGLDRVELHVKGLGYLIVLQAFNEPLAGDFPVEFRQTFDVFGVFLLILCLDQGVERVLCLVGDDLGSGRLALARTSYASQSA